MKWVLPHFISGLYLFSSCTEALIFLFLYLLWVPQKAAEEEAEVLGLSLPFCLVVKCVCVCVSICCLFIITSITSLPLPPSLPLTCH